jgi:hypothetical protein
MHHLKNFQSVQLNVKIYKNKRKRESAKLQHCIAIYESTTGGITAYMVTAQITALSDKSSHDGVAMGSPLTLTTAKFFMGSYQPAIGMA